MKNNDYLIQLESENEKCGMCGGKAKFVSVSFCVLVCGMNCEDKMWGRFEEDLKNASDRDKEALRVEDNWLEEYKNGILESNELFKKEYEELDSLGHADVLSPPEMTREEKIKYCEENAKEFGIHFDKQEYEDMSDEDLDKQVDWFDYLWTK